MSLGPRTAEGLRLLRSHLLTCNLKRIEKCTRRKKLRHLHLAMLFSTDSRRAGVFPRCSSGVVSSWRRVSTRPNSSNSGNVSVLPKMRNNLKYLGRRYQLYQTPKHQQRYSHFYGNRKPTGVSSPRAFAIDTSNSQNRLQAVMRPIFRGSAGLSRALCRVHALGFCIGAACRVAERYRV